MQQRIEQHRGVADRQHEAVAVRPERILRVVAQVAAARAYRRPVPVAIGVPGWPELAFWTASIASVRIVFIDSCLISTDMFSPSARSVHCLAGTFVREVSLWSARRGGRRQWIDRCICYEKVGTPKQGHAPGLSPPERTQTLAAGRPRPFGTRPLPWVKSFGRRKVPCPTTGPAGERALSPSRRRRKPRHNPDASATGPGGFRPDRRRPTGCAVRRARGARRCPGRGCRNPRPPAARS